MDEENGSGESMPAMQETGVRSLGQEIRSCVPP